ncbi:MAG TPA: HAD family hydrolase [Vicinamibacterales bacterium]|nr:HAD family hydrolase [Vicinamibacterales bacterium]
MIPGPHKAENSIKAVFFDVDFTLIYPGPTFQAQGYQRACAAHGIEVDPTKFDEATAASSFILDDVEEQIYTHDVFIHYTASIIEKMGGRGANVVEAARAIFEQWSVNHHFEMYDDVAPVLETLQKRGTIVGVISNSHRSLDAFREHFSLANIITVSVSGAEHGYMKPHRSIFDAALDRAKVKADEALMVGDSFKHDIEGALNAGWRAVLLRRSGEVPYTLPNNLPVIRTLPDLLPLLA